MPELTARKGFTISELVAVFGAALLLAAVLYPFARFTVQRRDVIQCQNNLQQIGKALYVYAAENKGRFPGSIEELYGKTYLGDISLLDCPASAVTGTPERPDYVYFPGLSVTSSSEKVLLKDRPGNHKGRGNVLLVSGEILRKEEE